MTNNTPRRADPLDPLPYTAEWPSLRSPFGRVDIHSLAAFWVHETKLRRAYCEFGVASGRSAIAALRANSRYNPDTVAPFLLFDSFQGLPELTGRDADSHQFSKGDFAFGKEQVVEMLTRHNVYEPNRIHLIGGFFRESLPRFDAARYCLHKAAIVHIDVDLYQSCAEALSFITPFLQCGTVVLFDDWNAFAASNSKGERAATSQWLARHPELALNEYASYGWHGKAFIVDMVAGQNVSP